MNADPTVLIKVAACQSADLGGDFNTSLMASGKKSPFFITFRQRTRFESAQSLNIQLSLRGS